MSGTGRVRYLWEAGKALVRGQEMERTGEETHAKVELSRRLRLPGPPPWSRMSSTSMA